MKLLFLTIFISFALITNAQDKPTYKIFTKSGKQSHYEEILKTAQKSDIILFGEYHDNPICHWLQIELTKDLYEFAGDKLILGGEMFESDDQLIVNEYLSGKISDKTFKDEAKIWPNYKTDYKPLIDFCKKNKLEFIATNVPRRYANLVYSKGLEALDSLEKDAKKYLPELPIDYDGSLKCYKEIFESAGGHGGENLPKSQALKDATMAYFIMKNWKKNSIFLHFNGAYHSNNYESIYWYLKNKNKKMNILTLSTVEQEKVQELNESNIGLADFIICVPENMTKTH